MGLFGTMGKKVFYSPKLKKRRFDPQKMSIEDISLPRVFKTFEDDLLRNLIKNEIDAYKALDYRNKTLEQIREKEFHSMQIGLMLRFIQEDMVYLYDMENILPTHIYHITKKQLHIKVFDIVFRYDQDVEKDSIKEELYKDMSWTAEEAGYLLRYITLDVDDRKISKV